MFFRKLFTGNDKIIESQNKQKQLNKISEEEQKEIKKMNEYKKLINEFHTNFNISNICDSMMYRYNSRIQ